MQIVILLFIIILSYFGIFWSNNILDKIVNSFESNWFTIFWVLFTFIVILLGFWWCLELISILIDLIL